MAVCSKNSRDASHRCPAQIFKRIGAPFLLGIDDHIRRGNPVLGLMMVCHNHRHSVVFCISDLIHRRNSIVAGQDGIHPFLIGVLDQMLIDAISVLHPVRNFIVYQSLTAFQPFVQNVSGIHSINIIISDDPDFLFLLNFPFYKCCCLIRSF